MSTTTVYQITGMTCDHCASAVTKELSFLPGVHGVEVDLDAGTAKVTSNAELHVGDVRSAVSEAGYTLVDTHA